MKGGRVFEDKASNLSISFRILLILLNHHRERLLHEKRITTHLLSPLVHHSIPISALYSTYAGTSKRTKFLRLLAHSLRKMEDVNDYEDLDEVKMLETYDPMAPGDDEGTPQFIIDEIKRMKENNESFPEDVTVYVYPVGGLL